MAYKIGDRIVLRHTDDPYTKLRPGDRGTITDITEIPQSAFMQVWVKWDSGSSLALLDGVDSFDVVSRRDDL